MKFLDLFKKKVSSGEGIPFNDIIDKGTQELNDNKISVWSAKAQDMKQTIDMLLALPDKSRVEFVLASIKVIHKYFDGRNTYAGSDPEYVHTITALTLMTHTLRTKLTVDEADVDVLVSAFMNYRRGNWADVTSWPIALLISTIDRNFPNALPATVQKRIESLREAIEKLNRSDRDVIKIVDKIDSLLFRSSSGNPGVKPTYFLGKDQFADFANQIIKQQPDDEKPLWYKLVQLAQKVSGSKPSEKFLKETKVLIKELPTDKFKKIVTEWFEFVVKLKEDAQTNHFISAPNIDALKGFVWMCCHFHDTHTLQVIAALCERSFKKIPSKGPAAAAVGNACLFTLYKSKGLEGIAHLSRLKLRVKQTNTQTLIEKYLQEAATNEGITVNEIEDLAVDDFGLQDGKIDFEIGGYKAIVRVHTIGDVQIEWYKPDNSQLKAAPSTVKTQYAQKLKEIKDTGKQIDVALLAQRDRVDRMFRSQREMSYEYFVKHYVAHGLMSLLAKDIIWRFRKDDDVWVCIFHGDKWKTLQDEEIHADASMMVSLWHPALATVEEIRQWRKHLIDQQIKQPIKQAFREVYLLTDAEINTVTYSNRMAAHILKQHQFNSLAKTRGWKYSLLGAYDDGRYNEGAELNLPDAKLRAEFWVNEVNADNQYNDTGIWNYVSTDQVRFVSLETNNPMELTTIPPVVFSEVMRDIDLFVGVASVGNDPAWSDSGGVPAHRDYWQAYSFGDLTEIAKTRKEILEDLIPRLKIASVTSIKDKFVIVKGKKRTYKIHIGSTNILMEPNDQYLCIVPDRSKKEAVGNVFLPFEGDNGLSVILSKAMLLAEDEKINDSTILTQIDRK
jgi:hypothetical protein